MKIWFKNSNPTKIISFGKSVGEADESFFEYQDELVHGYDHTFYNISGNTLLMKNQADVARIEADRHAAARGHAVKGVPSTRAEQKTATEPLYKILDDKGILER